MPKLSYSMGLERSARFKEARSMGLHVVAINPRLVMSLDIDNPTVDLEQIKSNVILNQILLNQTYFNVQVPFLVTRSYSGNCHVYILMDPDAKDYRKSPKCDCYLKLAVDLGSDKMREELSNKRRKTALGYFPYVMFETDEGLEKLKSWERTYNIDEMFYAGGMPALMVLEQMPDDDDSFAPKVL